VRHQVDRIDHASNSAPAPVRVGLGEEFRYFVHPTRRFISRTRSGARDFGAGHVSLRLGELAIDVVTHTHRIDGSARPPPLASQVPLDDPPTHAVRRPITATFPRAAARTPRALERPTPGQSGASSPGPTVSGFHSNSVQLCGHQRAVATREMLRARPARLRTARGCPTPSPCTLTFRPLLCLASVSLFRRRHSLGTSEAVSSRSRRQDRSRFGTAKSEITWRVEDGA